MVEVVQRGRARSSPRGQGSAAARARRAARGCPGGSSARRTAAATVAEPGPERGSRAGARRRTGSRRHGSANSSAPGAHHGRIRGGGIRPLALERQPSAVAAAARGRRCRDRSCPQAADHSCSTRATRCARSRRRSAGSEAPSSARALDLAAQRAPRSGAAGCSCPSRWGRAVPSPSRRAPRCACRRRSAGRPWPKRMRRASRPFARMPVMRGSFRMRSISSANTGPPIRAVTMPTGSSRGSNTVLAMVSAR